MTRPQVSRPVRYAVLALVGTLGVGLLWLGVNRLQAERRAAAAAARPGTAVSPEAAPASAPASALASARAAGVEKPKAEVVVHVAGAVANPGVFRLEPGGRVADAIAAAGGAAPGAMLDALNLAARLNDGDKIYVQTVQEAREAQAQAAAPPKAPARAPAAAAAARPVNINSASVADLDKVTGITPTVAKAIVAYRVQKGPFRQLDELTSVKGVDHALLERLKPRLTL